MKSAFAQEITPMKIAATALMTVALGVTAASAAANTYPPLAAYLLPQAEEIALARSAAPAAISAAASIEVLTPAGYTQVRAGANGFVCLVMRGFAAPTYTPAMFRDLVYDPSVHAPICFNRLATREVLPYYKLRTELAMRGRTPDQIQAGVEVAYKNGTLPKRTAVSFAYMWSTHQHLAPQIGHWHPHLMIFAPNSTNEDLGGNAFGSSLPQASDDAGTPFAVLLVPVGDENFVSKPGEGAAAARGHH
jgi:hypothetical protein